MLKANTDLQTMVIKPDVVQDNEEIFRHFKDVETEEVSQMSLLRENYKKSKQQDKDDIRKTAQKRNHTPARNTPQKTITSPDRETSTKKRVSSHKRLTISNLNMKQL